MIYRYGQIARQNWQDLDGYAVGHNMPDLRKLPLDRFCNWLWWMMTKNAKNEQEREKLRAKLWRPPPDLKGTAPIDKRSPWSAENEMKAFAAFKMQTTGKASVPKPPGEASA